MWWRFSFFLSFFFSGFCVSYRIGKAVELNKSNISKLIIIIIIIISKFIQRWYRKSDKNVLRMLRGNVRSGIIYLKNLTPRWRIFPNGIYDAAACHHYRPDFALGFDVAQTNRRSDRRICYRLGGQCAAHLIEDLIKRASRMNYYTYVIQREGRARGE